MLSYPKHGKTPLGRLTGFLEYATQVCKDKVKT
jgi:hypothetical protein